MTFPDDTVGKIVPVVASVGVRDPKVLMIDESGTGIDPVAQGRVWSIVSRVSRDRSVILTTHCMKEAHVLASRAAIMADGKFLRVGSVQHLKVSHGWISLSAEWC